MLPFWVPNTQLLSHAGRAQVTNVHLLVARVFPGFKHACGGRMQAHHTAHGQAPVRASAAHAATVTRPNVPVPGCTRPAVAGGAAVRGARAWRLSARHLGASCGALRPAYRL